jgi:hypothetical protein
MKIPVSLTSRVMTLAKRVVPRASFQVTRPGRTIERRTELRGVTKVFLSAMLNAGMMASLGNRTTQDYISINKPID